MATVYCIYVGDGGRNNLEYGLSAGRWAFTGDTPSIVDGDLLLFGTGVPRGPRITQGDWQSSRLGEAFLARALGPPYPNTTPFWPDEGSTVMYNPSVNIEFLGSLGALSLTPGEDLEARGGHRHENVRGEPFASLPSGHRFIARPHPETRSPALSSDAPRG